MSSRLYVFLALPVATFPLSFRRRHRSTELIGPFAVGNASYAGDGTGECSDILWGDEDGSPGIARLIHLPDDEEAVLVETDFGLRLIVEHDFCLRRFWVLVIRGANLS
jgi:hypothetical protein